MVSTLAFLGHLLNITKHASKYLYCVDLIVVIVVSSVIFAFNVVVVFVRSVVFAVVVVVVLVVNFLMFFSPLKVVICLCSF